MRSSQYGMAIESVMRLKREMIKRNITIVSVDETAFFECGFCSIALRTSSMPSLNKKKRSIGLHLAAAFTSNGLKAVNAGDKAFFREKF